jgi:hypothetical protein
MATGATAPWNPLYAEPARREDFPSVTNWGAGIDLTMIETFLTLSLDPSEWFFPALARGPKLLRPPAPVSAPAPVPAPAAAAEQEEDDEEEPKTKKRPRATKTAKQRTEEQTRALEKMRRIERDAEARIAAATAGRDPSAAVSAPAAAAAKPKGTTAPRKPSAKQLECYSKGMTRAKEILDDFRTEIADLDDAMAQTILQFVTFAQEQKKVKFWVK